jgi:hypothetical protein
MGVGSAAASPWTWDGSNRAELDGVGSLMVRAGTPTIGLEVDT